MSIVESLKRLQIKTELLHDYQTYEDLLEKAILLQEQVLDLQDSLEKEKCNAITECQRCETLRENLKEFLE